MHLDRQTLSGALSLQQGEGPASLGPCKDSGATPHTCLLISSRFGKLAGRSEHLRRRVRLLLQHIVQHVEGLQAGRQGALIRVRVVADQAPQLRLQGVQRRRSCLPGAGPSSAADAAVSAALAQAPSAPQLHLPLLGACKMRGSGSFPAQQCAGSQAVKALWREACPRCNTHTARPLSLRWHVSTWMVVAFSRICCIASPMSSVATISHSSSAASRARLLSITISSACGQTISGRTGQQPEFCLAVRMRWYCSMVRP